MLDDTYYFECDCGSSEHTIRFTLDKEDPTIYTSVFLNQYRSLWERVWVALKYVFGYKCRYGHWDCWSMRDSDARKLRDMCDDYLAKR